MNVSSCLAELEICYNKTHCLSDQVDTSVKENQAIPVCPELFAGFLTPREPAEIVGGNGVTTALLQRHGLKVISEVELSDQIG